MLRQNIFKVSIGSRILNIKIHRVKNDILGKMGSFKTDHPDFRSLRNGRRSLSLPDFATEPLCDFDGDDIGDLFLVTDKT